MTTTDMPRGKNKAWAILLYPDYDSKNGYVFGISTDKDETKDLYKKNGLYKPYYKIIPCEITYSLPPHSQYETI